MTATLTEHTGVSTPERGELETRLRDAGLDPRTWSNRPGYRYGRHAHSRHKILFCVDGAITFHTPDGDFSLDPGDRLDITPGTDHAATVSEHGVTCIEGFADNADDVP